MSIAHISNLFSSKLVLSFHTSILCMLGLSLSLNLSAQTFQSTQSKTQLLELYSSQGCSSCPPAERWVSKQLQHPGLWKQFIPVVFHVDYWDYLGWKDPFSNKSFSQRQRRYYAQGAVSSVYTPGIIYDGTEWRGWYKGQGFPVNTIKPGILQATLNKRHLQVNFNSKKTLNLNVALLGFGIKTDVEEGENEGNIFEENFIVLNKQTLISNNGKWNMKIQTKSKFKVARYALAIWINTPNSLQPLQATGGWVEVSSR